jgi:hypothetical protein
VSSSRRRPSRPRPSWTEPSKKSRLRLAKIRKGAQTPYIEQCFTQQKFACCATCNFLGTTNIMSFNTLKVYTNNKKMDTFFKTWKASSYLFWQMQNGPFLAVRVHQAFERVQIFVAWHHYSVQKATLLQKVACQATWPLTALLDI